MLLSMEQFRVFQPEKPTYALFGWPLGHTMSPELHAQLFAASGQDADYIGVAVPPEDLPEAFELAKRRLGGINCTIPHKKAVIPLLDEVDTAARNLHSVNTVAFRDGKAVGYNTDILGFAESLTRDGIRLRGKKVLLLGYGGAASVMAYHCVTQGAYLTITGRNLDKAESLRQQLCAAVPGAHIAVYNRRHIPRDIQIVLNSTPVGMYPRENAAPLHYLPHKAEYVFDAIYNPPITATMRLANPKKARVRDGLFMLVMQAAYAQTVWSGVRFEPQACETILRRTYGKMAVKRLHHHWPETRPSDRFGIYRRGSVFRGAGGQKNSRHFCGTGGSVFPRSGMRLHQGAFPAGRDCAFPRWWRGAPAGKRESSPRDRPAHPSGHAVLPHFEKPLLLQHPPALG